MFGWLRRRRPAAAEPATAFAHLVPGTRYHVVRAFLDYDQVGHPVGECWTYLRHGFLPYEDGLTLFVAMPDRKERWIRLQWRPERQGAIIDALDSYLSTTPIARRTITIALTRDGVCMGDDIAAPHAGVLEVEEAADADGIAEALLAANYLPHVGGEAIWSFAVEGVAVDLGVRGGMLFVNVRGAGASEVRASNVTALHIRYHGQPAVER